jgi:hypothetical protein
MTERSVARIGCGGVRARAGDLERRFGSLSRREYATIATKWPKN